MDNELKHSVSPIMIQLRLVNNDFSITIQYSMIYVLPQIGHYVITNADDYELSGEVVVFKVNRIFHPFNWLDTLPGYPIVHAAYIGVFAEDELHNLPHM